MDHDHCANDIQYFTTHEKIGLWYGDYHAGVDKALKNMTINPEYSHPGDPTNNAIAERNVQDMEIGIRGLLEQAGMPACFWPWAMACYYFCENARYRFTSTGEYTTPYFLRFGRHCKAMIIPFGCGVYYMPPKTKPETSKAAPRLRYGIFIGYDIAPGGEWAEWGGGG